MLPLMLAFFAGGLVRNIKHPGKTIAARAMGCYVAVEFLELPNQQKTAQVIFRTGMCIRSFWLVFG